MKLRSHPPLSDNPPLINHPGKLRTLGGYTLGRQIIIAGGGIDERCGVRMLLAYAAALVIWAFGMDGDVDGGR